MADEQAAPWEPANFGAFAFVLFPLVATGTGYSASAAWARLLAQ